MTAIRQHPMTGGTSTTEGLVSYVVDGAFPPFLGLAAITDGHLVRYVATDGVQFEEGYGVKSAGPTLTRAIILRTSAGDTDKIDWGTGTRVVYVVPDLDTVFEAHDGTHVRMLKHPQVESDDAGEVTRKFRLWSGDGKLYLSVSSESPFDHLLRYDAAAETPTLMLDQPVDAAGGLKIGGVATQAPAISAFADTAAAQAGSSSAVVMNPATTADALATDSLVIGNRTSAATALATMEVLVKLTGGGLRRLLLSAVKTLVNTPDYALTAGTIPAGAGILTATHGLGAEPAQVEWLFRCGTADQGYSVGDTIEPATSDTSDNQQTLTIGKNATQAFIVVPATITIRHKSTFAQASMTKASWTAEVRCWL